MPSLSSASSESDIIARVEAAGNKITNNYGGGIGVYYGQMEGGQCNGYGTWTYASGSKYVGEWKNNKRHGQGTHTLASGIYYSGTIHHSGEWKHGKPFVSFILIFVVYELLLLLFSFSYNFHL